MWPLCIHYLGDLMLSDTNVPAPSESLPRESRTAQFYQATVPSYIAARTSHYYDGVSPDRAQNHHDRLMSYSQKEWDKPPVGSDDEPEYREPRSWRDNPLYNRTR
jgi:hypothetical protein